MSVSTRPEYMGVPVVSGPVVLVGVALLHGLDLHELKLYNFSFSRSIELEKLLCSFEGGT